MAIPTTGKGIVVRKAQEANALGYKNDAPLVSYPIPALKKGQILVRIAAVAFNHKDVWIRKGMYPGITQGAFYGGDGAGVVVASGDEGDALVNQRVFLTPSRGWWADPTGPEDGGVFPLGGFKLSPGGTFAEYIVLEREHVIPTPQHLDDLQAAAWPLGGVTAWRAAMVNAGVKAGHAVIITGIGGGVALQALQFCVAAGASVYVTSGSQEKLQKAIALGAKGGASYKDEDWPTQLLTQLRKEKAGAYFDAVIDSSGGEILAKVAKQKCIRSGGKVVCYGMTAGGTITMTMREVLLNLQLIGSTMGSHKDLEDATRFMEQHKLVPVVSHVLDGLESAEQGFQLIHRGEQFGKVVIKLREPSSGGTSARL